MLLLTITYKKLKKELVSELDNIIKNLKSKNIDLGIYDSSLDGMYFIKIFSRNDDISDREKEILNIHVANVIYNTMVYEFYEKEVDGFLCDTYFFLKSDETQDIKDKILNILINDCEITDENIIYCINRKNEIKKNIIEFLQQNDEINIDGFITFRMKEMKYKFQEIIDKIVEKYMVEKEYNEFIKLLKYFVDIQESKIETVNIIIKPNGEYVIQDNNEKDIIKQLVENISQENENDMVSVDDLIMSGLVTNSPSNIIIHGEENTNNKEFINTIKNVFGKRVKICKGCKMCKIKLNKSH
ncbi:putative sporulation protein YtxC [Haloimpatiens sp. FM7330]|uniref:putative sporulation protein YtxC n=1 Tax=Haloimpatiens sp. FM7330 TaxID=3298610 RepID=UPI003627B660